MSLRRQCQDHPCFPATPTSPPSHIFIISVVAQAEPALVHPWVTSEDGIYKLDIGQSDILDSFVVSSTMACCSMIIFIASVYLSLDVSLQDSNVKPGLGAVLRFTGPSTV